MLGEDEKFLYCFIAMAKQPDGDDFAMD